MTRPDDDDDDDEHHALPHDFKPHESPWTMTVPLIVLAVLSTVGGLVGIPYAMSVRRWYRTYFERTLEPVIAEVGRSSRTRRAVDGSTRDTRLKPPAHRMSSTAAARECRSRTLPKRYRPNACWPCCRCCLPSSGIAIGIALFGKTPLRKLPRILVEKWRDR